MKRTLLALLICLAPAFAQAPKLDKAKVEAYLRHLELWVPQVNVAVQDPTPSTYMPGYMDLVVRLTFNGNSADVKYYISPDGKNIVKGDAYDLSKSPFQANLDKLKTDLQPSFGTPGAPAVIVVFGDFQCPYCKEEANVVRKNLQAAFDGKFRVYFKDFPLDTIHPWAKPASIAGRCVFRQNAQKFWDYFDWAYANQQEITPENFDAKAKEWAAGAGIDAKQFGTCVDTKATLAEVEASQAEGRALGVDGTPTLYLNGRKLMDSMTQWQALQALVAFELDHQAKTPDAGEKCCEVKMPIVGK
mgnify:FL=1